MKDAASLGNGAPGRKVSFISRQLCCRYLEHRTFRGMRRLDAQQGLLDLLAFWHEVVAPRGRDPELQLSRDSCAQQTVGAAR